MAKKNDETAWKKFFRENKSLTFMLPVLVILIIAAIIINLSLGNDKEAAKSNPSSTESSDVNSSAIDTNQPQVDVLPQIIRADNPEEVELQKDPFESPMNLTGVVLSSLKSTAIIEWGGYSYIVEINDNIGNSKWKVSRIEKDNVALDNGSESIVLVLTGK